MAAAVAGEVLPGGQRRTLDPAPTRPVDLDPRRVQVGHLVVLEVEQPLHSAGEGAAHRRQVAAVAAVTEDEGAGAPGRHQAAGLADVAGGEGEVPAQLRRDRRDGACEIAPVGLLDEVRDDLGIGLRAEVVAARHQLRAQLGEVLDDPVEDDGELAATGRQRVGVLDRDAAVRCPARVADTAADLEIIRQVCREPGDGTNRPLHLQGAADVERHPRRVVTAVLEQLQPLEQALGDVRRARVADDPAHAYLPPFALAGALGGAGSVP
jgi:hypothetical protein